MEELLNHLENRVARLEGGFKPTSKKRQRRQPRNVFKLTLEESLITKTKKNNIIRKHKTIFQVAFVNEFDLIEFIQENRKINESVWGEWEEERPTLGIRISDELTSYGEKRGDGVTAFRTIHITIPIGYDQENIISEINDHFQI